MRIIASLEAEFIDVCFEYPKRPYGQDIITLVTKFADEYDYFDEDTDNLMIRMAWGQFLDEHQHQMTIPMVGMVIYLLLTYWPEGQRMFQALPTLEKMLLRDTFSEISDEIDKQSAANGDMLITPGEADTVPA